jgi:hypothetical protein
VTPAGHFAVIQTSESRAIVIVQNWFEHLKQLIPVD